MTVDDIFAVKDKVVIRYTVEGTEKREKKGSALGRLELPLLG